MVYSASLHKYIRIGSWQYRLEEMHKRLIATSLFGLALIFSQGGVLFVAALCPHLNRVAESCEKPTREAESNHNHGQPLQTKSDSNQSSTSHEVNVLARQSPVNPCDHCAVHSRTDSTVVSLREGHITKRGDVPVPATAVSVVQAIPTAPIAVLSSRAHGPPGTNVSTYILINAFRI